MPVNEIRRTGVDPTQNVWDTMIYGAPNVAPGYHLAKGSRAVQVDSTPNYVVWYKFGQNDTDWQPVFFDPTTNPILVANLPSNTNQVVERSVVDLLDPLQAAGQDRGGSVLSDGAADDVRFRLKAALQ